MPRLSYFLVILILAGSGKAFAQASDTLTLAQFEQMVIEQNPVVRQAFLYKKKADAELREARGRFDPKIGYQQSEKLLGGKNYYRTRQVTGSIPLRAGIDLYGGFEKNTGIYIDPMISTQGSGLWFGGVNVSVGRGLFIDDRRAGVLSAQVVQRMADALARQYATKYLLTARKDYWSWYAAKRQRAFIEEGVGLAEQRLEAIRQKAEIGEEAGIDTVEALLQVLDRRNARNQIGLELDQAWNRVLSHLWQQSVPVQLSKTQNPERFRFRSFPYNLQDSSFSGIAVRRNPQLVTLMADLETLRIQRRLSIENLKPSINLKYQVLSMQGSEGEAGLPVYLENNYCFGADVEMPIFLRKERGKLQQVKVKEQQIELQIQQTVRDIEIEADNQWLQLTALRDQIGTQRRMVENYTKLRNGEVIKFSMGESSLFLVNSRETKLIEAQIKLADLESKWQKTHAEMLFLTGTLPDTPY